MTIAQLINGKEVSVKIKSRVRQYIQHRVQLGDPAPGLAVILIGDDPASGIYVRNKREACQEVGITSFYHQLSTETTEKTLIELIQVLNQDSNVHGILLQLPLPSHINADHVLEHILPSKDVDGFHPYNLGRLAQRRPLLTPCTPKGIMILLDEIGQLYKSKHAVIVGASNIVGRPMALELLIAGATVTVCHRFTDDLSYFVKQADILISAVGKPGLIKGAWIKNGSTLIDVGITRLENGTLAGDIEFDLAKEKAAWITPVPGGVGPMTVASLLINTITAAYQCSFEMNKD